MLALDYASMGAIVVIRNVAPMVTIAIQTLDTQPKKYLRLSFSSDQQLPTKKKPRGFPQGFSVCSQLLAKFPIRVSPLAATTFEFSQLSAISAVVDVWASIITLVFGKITRQVH